MHAAAAAEVYGEQGFGYDPTLEAAERGIAIEHDPTAADTGQYDPDTMTITVQQNGRTHYRSTVTFQLAHAVLATPNTADAVEFACSRLIDHNDLVALALATPDRRLWARALNVRQWLLDAYLQVRSGLPVAT